MIAGKRARRYLFFFVAAGIMILGAVSITKIYRGKYHKWVRDYHFNSQSRNSMDGTVDIIFTVIDHWEPGRKSPEKNLERTRRWTQEYPALADKHIDSDGRKLQRTFFYPIEQFQGYQIDSLVRICARGYGDIEVHLHHANDTPESLREKFRDGIDSLQAHGALISGDGEIHFAFVHGYFALDNSLIENGRNFCGVNNEIDLLIELGCYADFTFPALCTDAQPAIVNKIFYAKDDPGPKSYNKGEISHVGIDPGPDRLMIFPGPIAIDWSDWRFGLHPTIDDGDLYCDMTPSIKRFDKWVQADIHVLGGPNWVFVRPHTHGCEKGCMEANLGPEMDEMLTLVEKKYRDNPGFRLHYMTAREAYNVARAAEAGMTGNPYDYRDFVIKPYQYRIPVDTLKPS